MNNVARLQILLYHCAGNIGWNMQSFFLMYGKDFAHECICSLENEKEGEKNLVH